MDLYAKVLVSVSVLFELVEPRLRIRFRRFRSLYLFLILIFYMYICTLYVDILSNESIYLYNPTTKCSSFSQICRHVSNSNNIGTIAGNVATSGSVI
jgi:hypothetical protein